MVLDPREVGWKTVFSATFPASSKALEGLYQDTITTVRKHGRPGLFITFASNPSGLNCGIFFCPVRQTAENRPDVKSRLFQLKLNALLMDRPMATIEPS